MFFKTLNESKDKFRRVSQNMKWHKISNIKKDEKSPNIKCHKIKKIKTVIKYENSQKIICYKNKYVTKD